MLKTSTPPSASPRTPGARGAARRRRPVVPQPYMDRAHPAEGAVQRRHRARCDVGERRVGGRGHTARPATRCCRCQPGTLPVGELTCRLADADAAVVVKLGRSCSQCAEALSGLPATRVHVERASTAGQRAAGRRRDQRAVLSLAMLPGGRRRALLTGTVAVVAWGPGDMTG